MPRGPFALAALLVAAGCRAEPLRGPPPEGEAGLRAERLLEDAGCVGCHAAPAGLAERIEPVPAPDLGTIGARVAPQHIARLLEDPQSARPGTRMPDLLAALAPREREAARAELLHYLVSRGGPLAVEPVEVDPGSIERGRLAYHELGCVACHGPLEDAWRLEYLHWALEGDDAPRGPDEPPPRAAPTPWNAVPLGDPRRRTSVERLAAFLLEPRADRPHGRMPSLDLDAATALDLARYLVRDPQRDRGARLPGLAVEVYLDEFAVHTPDWDALAPVERRVVATFEELAPPRADGFGFRVRGFLEIERAGTYVFSTESDDGSSLALDGELLIENQGEHPMTRVEGSRWLDSGSHALELGWFEYLGGEELKVRWSGPGFEEQPLPAERLSHSSLLVGPRDAAPFAIDDALAERGARRFATLGCGACHTLDGARVDAPAAPALVELDADSHHGCLGDEPGRGTPGYALSAAERALLVELVAGAEGPWAPLSEHDELARALDRNACLACHARDGSGGPEREHWPYFATRGEADLGDEGRLPPTLEHAGAKLTEAALAGVLLAGERVRPYMATRMPIYPREVVEPIANALARLDADALGAPAPASEAAAPELGARLAGTRGLGCVQCHGFSEHPSLGIPAPNLADVARRVRPQWFQRLLADPESLGMNSRMPQFWSDGTSPVRDVLDGDPQRQIAALWAWLSLGHAAPLPEGLAVPDAAYELAVHDEPVCVGVFMDGVSPRTLCVGFPERTHYAFDMQSSRLALAWRGRFLNARGTWEGRAGALERPPSADVLALPRGPALAFLDGAAEIWPAEVEARALGRRHDERRVPILRYALRDVTVEERVAPQLRGDGAWLVRRFELSAPAHPGNLWMRALVEEELREGPAGTWVGASGARVELRAPALRRSAGEREELLVPIAFEERDGLWRAELELAFTW
jgi:cytochrome c553